MKNLVRSLVAVGCVTFAWAQTLEVTTTDFTSQPLRGRVMLQCDSPYYFGLKNAVVTNTVYFSNVVAGVYLLTLARPVGSFQYTFVMPVAGSNDVLDAYNLYASIPAVLTSAPWTNWLGVYGVFHGNGASITNLNATNLTTGTVPMARLSTTLLTNNSTGVWWSNTTGIAGNGAGLIGLNANNLDVGTVPLARLAGITTDQLTGTLTNPTSGNAATATLATNATTATLASYVSGTLTNATTGNASTATLATNAITATNVVDATWQTNTIIYVSNVVGVTNETGAYTNLTLTLTTNTFYWLGR